MLGITTIDTTGGGEVAGEGTPTLLTGSGIPSGRCQLNGFAIECEEAFRLLQSGAAAMCPNDDCGPRRVIYQGQRTWAHFQAYADGYQGYVPSTARYIGNGNISPTNGLRPVMGGRGFSATDTNLGRLNGAGSGEEVLGHSADVMFLNAGFGGQPQKSLSSSSVLSRVRPNRRIPHDRLTDSSDVAINYHT